jgi:hypothetical protein
MDTASRATDVLMDRDPVANKAVSDETALVLTVRRATLQATTREVPVNAVSAGITLLRVAKSAVSDKLLVLLFAAEQHQK